MNKNVSRSAVKNNVFNKNQQQNQMLSIYFLLQKVVNMGRRRKKNTVKLLQSSSNIQKYFINHHHTHFNNRNVGSEHKTFNPCLKKCWVQVALDWGVSTMCA